MFGNVNGEAEMPKMLRQTDWIKTAWTREPQTFHANCEGARIACRGWNLDASHLPGLVLVHGFLAHARWWDHIAPHLSATHRVVAMDLSGMGDSDRRSCYRRATYAQEIVAVADAAGFDRPVLAAHSYGTVGSLIACNRYPARFARLIMMDAVVPRPIAPRLTEVPPRYYASREEGLARYRLTPPGLWPDPEVLAYIAYHSLTQTDAGWTWKFDPQVAFSLAAETSYQLAEFGTSVAIDFIYGDQSEVIDLERLEATRQLSPQPGIPVVIPASHHHIMIEQPAALLAALRGVLARPV